MMESISSKVRLSLWPYSAAQQPVQCRLQALVGSSRMAQGMLHWYLSRMRSCSGQAIRLPSMAKVFTSLLRTAGFRSMIFMISWYQLFLVSSAVRKASRWLGNRPSGATLSRAFMILVALVTGSARK